MRYGVGGPVAQNRHSVVHTARGIRHALEVSADKARPSPTRALSPCKQTNKQTNRRGLRSGRLPAVWHRQREGIAMGYPVDCGVSDWPYSGVPGSGRRSFVRYGAAAPTYGLSRLRPIPTYGPIPKYGVTLWPDSHLRCDSMARFPLTADSY